MLAYESAAMAKRILILNSVFQINAQNIEMFVKIHWTTNIDKLR